MKCYLPEMARLKLGFLGFLICGLACADVTPVTVKQAVERMKKSSEIIVVDIRTPGEFSKGHIKKAINIDMNNKDFAKKLTKLDREKTYLMHCRSGGRSTASLPVWNRLGFKNVPSPFEWDSWLGEGLDSLWWLLRKSKIPNLFPSGDDTIEGNDAMAGPSSGDSGRIFRKFSGNGFRCLSRIRHYHSDRALVDV
jgi:rhodanese-related sulfurtransferase